MPCDPSKGESCEAGSPYPLAAAGYFAELTTSTTGENSTVITACIPFPYACLGTCSDEDASFIAAQDSFTETEQVASLSSCPAGLGKDSCTLGYGGPRCSLCLAYDADAQCTDDVPNGYYRLESRCEPCPCNSWCAQDLLLTSACV